MSTYVFLTIICTPLPLSCFAMIYRDPQATARPPRTAQWHQYWLTAWAASALIVYPATNVHQQPGVSQATCYRSLLKL